MTLNEVRALFPHLSTDQIYFNHAAVGPWCKFALDRINEFSVQMSGQKIENFHQFLKWSTAAKEKLAKIIGAQTDRIAWVDNVSNGLNMLAQGIDWKQGDRIILNDLEFPSNVYPFINLKQYGVEIDFVKSIDGKIEIDDIIKTVTPRTKLISVSLVQFLSGFRIDVEELGNYCRQKGIIFCVDAIQGTGVVEINVEKSKIDFLIGGTHKWLMSSQGLTYLFITKELQDMLNQKYIGWTSVEDAWNLLDYNLTLKSSAERFQNGTLNALGVSIFEAVLDLFINFGMQNVEAKILGNTEYFINCLSEIGIDPILKSVDNKNRAGIVSFMHDNSKQIFDELEKRKIYCAIREGMVRLSPHFYNDKEEIDSVVESINEILK